MCVCGVAVVIVGSWLVITAGVTPILPSRHRVPTPQYKGYSPQSALIQMIFNIPAPVLPVLPVLPGPGHYQLLLMEAAR